ncbi:MAG: hypothetical protein RBR15_11440 [Sphaerochaeta sp.]|nr:hypothetical protein [Sphaerochaeta sp.]
MVKRTTTLILLLFLTFVPLSAAITATYAQVQTPDLIFTKGTAPFFPTQIVAHLGTLTITATEGETLYQPSLVDAQIDSTFNFTGPVTWGNHWQTGLPVYQNQSTVFFLAAVTTELGVTGYRRLWSGGGTAPMTTTQKALGVSVFEAKLYLLGDQRSSIYKPGAIYTMPYGNIGSFNVAVAANDQGINYNYKPKIYVPVGSQTIPANGSPPMNSPLITPPGKPAIPYGEKPQEVIYGFSIIDEQALTLPRGYLHNTTLIAKAQLNLSNASPGHTYGVEIQFSKQQGSTSFELRPTNNPLGYAIPYQLQFLGEPVKLDDKIPWTPLTEGSNTQNILITGISPTVAEAAPSGLYEDTIVVTISAIELLTHQ